MFIFLTSNAHSELFSDVSKAGDPENLYQISLLIDHLKHDEVLFREQASRSLALIGWRNF
jgi:hypothetical protein